MTAASDCGEQAVVPREVDRRDDVGNPRAASDERGVLIDAGIPNLTGLVVAAVGWLQQLTGEPGCEGADIQCKHAAV